LEGKYMSDNQIEVETLKNIMLSKATGGAVNGGEYRIIRDKLTKSEKLKPLLPRCLFTCRTIDEFWGHMKEVSGTYQGRRDYLRDEFSPVLEYLESTAEAPSDNVILNTLDDKNGATYIQDAWSKALERRESDPEGAITSARTLLESVCKFILDESDVEYDDKAELPQLYKGVQKTLKLAPDDHTEDIFKQILGGCTTIVVGLGSVRNKLSDAHGRSAKAVKPSKRHAQFAVNVAGATADFLFSTWENKQLQELH
jgi:hypothetical protein